MISNASLPKSRGRNKELTDHDLIANLHRRMDSQDRMLTEIRDTMTDHIARQSEIKPALDELVALWKGSKILIPILAGLSAGVWAFLVWAKEHIR